MNQEAPKLQVKTVNSLAYLAGFLVVIISHTSSAMVIKPSSTAKYSCELTIRLPKTLIHNVHLPARDADFICSDNTLLHTNFTRIHMRLKSAKSPSTFRDWLTRLSPSQGDLEVVIEGLQIDDLRFLSQPIDLKWEEQASLKEIIKTFSEVEARQNGKTLFSGKARVHMGSFHGVGLTQVSKDLQRIEIESYSGRP